MPNDDWPLAAEHLNGDVDALLGLKVVVPAPYVVPGPQGSAVIEAGPAGHRVIDLTDGAIGMRDEALELSIVMPCLDEAETIAACIGKASLAIERLGLRAEIVVADNGSTDGSQAIAERLGARVVGVEARGYGNAIMGGMAVAMGRYVLIGDADDSYDFGDLAPFLDKLREGHDLVIGNRFHGDFRPGAMPAMHRYVGTPALTGIERLLFRSPIGDLNCGLRALRRSVVPRLDLRSPGMEFASEMIVKASLRGLRIAEVPTTLSPAGRSRPPHLRAWRDGWRHLRFLLFHSPTWLFLYPGMALGFAGLTVLFGVLVGRSAGGGAPAFFLGPLMLAAGYQSVLFSCLAKNFAVGEGLLPGGDRLHRLSSRLTLERGLVVGFVLLVPAATPGTGVGLERSAVLGFASMMLGGQTVLTSLLLGVIGLARR